MDYYGKLSAQLPPQPLCLVYATSGTWPAASLVRDATAVFDMSLYWAAPGEEEARYLAAILNSETARKQIEHLQSRGQWGARHFAKLMFELPIPRFKASASLHRELAEATEHAEEVAAAVVLDEGMYFVTARKRIREALEDDGIADGIDQLVARLLG